MKNIVIAIIIVVVVGAGGYAVMRYAVQKPVASVNPASTPSVNPTNSATPSATGEPASADSPTSTLAPIAPGSQTKTFTVTASNFSFAPNEIKVKRGDTVVIKLENADGFHDWVLDEFNVRTPKINGGESSTVQFTADKTGTFEYYCSVGTHRQMGMKGNLVVTE